MLSLGSSKEVWACRTGSKENFHSNLRRDRLQPPWLLLLVKGRPSNPRFCEGSCNHRQIAFLDLCQFTVSIYARFHEWGHVIPHKINWLCHAARLAIGDTLNAFKPLSFLLFLASLLSRCGPGLFFEGRANWLELPDWSPYLKIVRPVQKSIVWIFWSTVMSSSTTAELSSEKCKLRTGRPLNSTFLSNMVTRSECKDLANSPPTHHQARTTSYVAGDDTLSKFCWWGHVAKNHWCDVGSVRQQPIENQTHEQMGEPFVEELHCWIPHVDNRSICHMARGPQCSQHVECWPMLRPRSQSDLPVWNHPHKRPTCNCTQHDRRCFAIHQGEFVSNLLCRFCCSNGFPKYHRYRGAHIKLRPKAPLAVARKAKWAHQ